MDWTILWWIIAILLVLAGLGQMYGDVGEVLAQGAPIGLMGGADPRAGERTYQTLVQVAGRAGRAGGGAGAGAGDGVAPAAPEDAGKGGVEERKSGNGGDGGDSYLGFRRGFSLVRRLVSSAGLSKRASRRASGPQSAGRSVSLSLPLLLSLPPSSTLLPPLLLSLPLPPLPRLLLLRRSSSPPPTSAIPVEVVDGATPAPSLLEGAPSPASR